MSTDLLNLVAVRLQVLAATIMAAVEASAGMSSRWRKKVASSIWSQYHRHGPSKAREIASEQMASAETNHALGGDYAQCGNRQQIIMKQKKLDT